MEMIEVITLSPDSSPAKKERRASGAREDVDGGSVIDWRVQSIIYLITFFLEVY